MISSQDLARLLNGLLHSAPELSAQSFSDIVIDSREATPGALFLALRGEHADGHQFVDDALRRGASAALVSVASGLTGAQHFVVDDPLSALQEAGRRWRSYVSSQIIGITGSVGKTTVRETTYQLLAQRFRVHQSPRNFNGDIGLPIALLGIDAEDEWAVIEIGPYSLEEMQLLVGSARSDVCIVTNVGPTHLERFGAIEDTEHIKGLLPASVPAGGLAILNGDDPRVRRMAQRTDADPFFFGLGEDNDLFATDVIADGFDGISFTMHVKGHKGSVGSVQVETPLVGSHQARTVLAASAVGLRAGITLNELPPMLAELEPGSRLARRRSSRSADVIDDAYNAAPLSMQAALDLLAACQPRRIALLGDMFELGSEEQAAHEQIGRYAAERCDWLLAVGERSRYLIEAARAAGHPHACWLAEADQAADILRQALEPSDTLLVKASHAMHLERVVEELCGS